MHAAIAPNASTTSTFPTKKSKFVSLRTASQTNFASGIRCSACCSQTHPSVRDGVGVAGSSAYCLTLRSYFPPNKYSSSPCGTTRLPYDAINIRAAASVTAQTPQTNAAATQRGSTSGAIVGAGTSPTPPDITKGDLRGLIRCTPSVDRAE